MRHVPNALRYQWRLSLNCYKLTNKGSSVEDLGEYEAKGLAEVRDTQREGRRYSGRSMYVRGREAR